MIRWLFLLALGLGVACAAAEESSLAVSESSQGCLDCHAGPEVDPVLHGPHARVAGNDCATCHGASLAHQQRPPRGQPRAAPDRHFDDAGDGDAICIDCHRDDAGLHWSNSAHRRNDIGCSSCHRIHRDDPMRDAESEVATCVDCHRNVRAELLRPSTHPLHDGRMGCSDCHAPHGSATPAMLARPTANETCYDCHAELRGPFLWEHPPAREDCMICHRPHGTVHRPLLRQRGPWLCQQCHMAQFHPSTALSGSGLPGPQLPSGSTSLLGRNCMNCHSQVHGSNHPSGAGFTR